MSHKVAFYPCCGFDFQEPIEILEELVDEIIFCDSNRILKSEGELVLKKNPPSNLKVTFISGDAREVLKNLSEINIFFYRGDSSGEGGSGIYFLGKKLIKKIIDKFPNGNGLIITDGSNSGNHLFNKMSRPDGYILLSNWHFSPTTVQPFKERYNLTQINVTPTSHARD